MAVNTAEDVNTTYRIVCECCGMRLRGSPAARAYKEKLELRKTRKCRILRVIDPD